MWQQQAQEWLSAVGYRLARLHDEGAFFMAYDESPTNDTRTRIREELKTVRHRLVPYVGFFNLLREAQGSDPQLHAGDVVWLTEISEAVRNSSALERRLADMRELADNRVTDSTATVSRVQKMFKILEEAGYLQQTNEVSKGYTFTGKVDYQWLAGFLKGRPSLAVFRGAPGYFRTDVANELLVQDHRPVLAFFDFDPKGLSMAASVPRREALCLPPLDSLEVAAKGQRRKDLYLGSVEVSRPHLQAQPEEGDVGPAWGLMKRLEMGLDQEHFPFI